MAQIATVLSEDELVALRTRWEQARARLEVLLPTYSNAAQDFGVARTLLKDKRPKLRRMIANARELPLTVELPTAQLEDLDLGGIMQESKNVAAGLKSVWKRLNGAAAGSKRRPWQRPSSPPAAPQGAPGGSGRLGTPRARPSRWAPSHRLGGPSEPPPRWSISPPLTV